MNHMFNVEVAEKYGMAEAVILEGMSFWCRSNAANGRNIHDGLAYTYNSIRALHELYPYLSEKKIRGAIATLERGGLLVSGCFNKKPYDRTKWYAVTEKGFSEMGDSILTKGQMNFDKMENENPQKGGPIPVVSTVDSPVVSEMEEEPRKSSADELMGIYNDACPSLPKCRAVTDKRRREARKLLKTFTVDDFRDICRKAQASAFMRGENERGWRADFDFLVSERGAAATLEGKYDDRRPVQQGAVCSPIREEDIPDEWQDWDKI